MEWMGRNKINTSNYYIFKVTLNNADKNQREFLDLNELLQADNLMLDEEY